MDSIQKQARRAGLFYFLACVPAPFALVFVPRALVVAGDASATADRVRASEALLRWGVGCEISSVMLMIFALIALYDLYKPVGRRSAALMVILFLVSIPVSLVNVLNPIAAVLLAKGPSFLAAMDRRQLDGLVYLFLRLHGQGLVVAQIFWGLWLFPQGILAMRSGFIPRVLGALLFVAGTGYVVDSFVTLCLPQLAHQVGSIPLALEAGEGPMILWLLLRGATKTARAPGEPVLGRAAVAGTP